MYMRSALIEQLLFMFFFRFFLLSFHYLLFHLRLRFLSSLFSRLAVAALLRLGFFFYDRIKEYVRRGNGEAVFRNYTSARGFQTAGIIGYLCTVECTIALSKLLGLMRSGADVFCCNQNFLSISFFFRSGVKYGRSVCAM